MIKLTKLIYTLKTEASEKLHNIEQIAQKEMYEWEKEMEESKTYDGDYIPTPFIESFEFTNDDYNVVEAPYRIRVEDIISYGEDKEGNVMLTERSTGTSYIIKESVDLLDKICEVK